MPFVPVPNTVAVDVVYELDSQSIENTLYFSKATAVAPEDLAALVEKVNETIRGNLIPLLSNVIHLLRVVGTLLDVVEGLVYVSTTSLPLAGGISEEPVPSNVAGCISLRTGLSGRSFRGRNYIPAIPNSLVSLNTMSSVFTTDVEGAYAQLRTNVDEIGWTHVIVSRFSGFTIVDSRKVPTPREEGIATPVINSFFVDATVDSQRRRLPGRGR
jgi:hypothetical protein